MGNTALTIAAEAYRQCNLDSELTSFSTTQEWPYKTALTYINDIISEMNRMGNLYFTETETALAYSPSTSSWDLSALNVDPRRVFRVRRTLTNYEGDLESINYQTFQRRYRTNGTGTNNAPQRYSRYANTLYTDVAPDQDYSLKVYHFRDMPAVTTTSDTLLLPERDEDVLRQGIKSYVLRDMGRDDWQAQYQIFVSKVSSMLVAMKNDSALPTRMPAAF